MKRWLRRVLLAAALATQAGCGLTGGTSKQVVHIEAPAGRERPVVDVAAVELEAGGSKLTNVGTFAWGKYEPEDLETLRVSLHESLAPFLGPRGYHLYLVVRRYLVAQSNSEGLALACVAWALTAPDASLVYHEQFYAKSYVRLWGTLGGIKDDVHRGIVQRVLAAAVRLAASGGTEDPHPAAEYTFDTFEKAIAGLPEHLHSYYTGIIFGGGYQIFYSHTLSGGSQLAWAATPDHVAWPAYLAAHGAPVPAPAPPAQPSP
jgi:hypothetical protein